MIAEIGEYNHREAILPLENGRSMSMIADSIVGNMDYPPGQDNSASLRAQEEQNALLREPK